MALKISSLLKYEDKGIQVCAM